MLASIFGTPGCGKTVFLGLLYETMVQFTNSPENEGPGEMRFTMEPQETKAFGDIRLDLLSGKWPSLTSADLISHCRMELGFRRRAFLGLLPSQDFEAMSIQNLDLGPRDARALKETSFFQEAMASGDLSGNIDLGSFSESFRDALECNVLVLPLDGDVLPTEDGHIPLARVKEVDAMYATIVGAIKKHGERRNRDGRRPIRIQPVIFLIRSEPKRGQSDEALSDTGTGTAEKVIRQHLPMTVRSIEEGQTGKVRFEKIKTYDSWLRTEANECGVPIPAYRTGQGQVSLDYSYEEHVSFIKLLSKTVRRK